MQKHLAHVVPELFDLLEHDQVLDALWEFTESLAGLIREKKNSIWSFIIRSSYRPAMLKEQFDFIIGNPPWLSYRYIADPEYQDEVKRRAVDRYQIAPKSQKLMTQMELATVFMAHSMATFAGANCRLAFVMPRGVLSADQHQNLILRKYASITRMKLTGYWDLWVFFLSSMCLRVSSSRSANFQSAATRRSYQFSNGAALSPAAMCRGMLPRPY